MLLAHSTTTPALQQVARLLHAQPYAVRVDLPPERAPEALARLVSRYPTITAHRNAQSALRAYGVPVVQLVIMPPRQNGLSALLLASLPPDDRENWQLALDERQPLTWGPYSVTTAARMQQEADKLRRPRPKRASDANRITWRLSQEVREAHRRDITRTIHATRPGPKAQRSGAPRITRTVPGKRARLEALGRHLAAYPGLSGVNTDRWMFQAHMRRLWNQQHPGEQLPVWPRYPYVTNLPAQLVTLPELLQLAAEQDEV